MRPSPAADCRVLVCDIRLPDLGGKRVSRRDVPDLGATPVIFITAFGEVEQAVRLMQAGADDYVTKPLGIEVLLHKMVCALRAGSRRRQRHARPGDPERLRCDARCRGLNCCV